MTAQSGLELHTGEPDPGRAAAAAPQDLPRLDVDALTDRLATALVRGRRFVIGIGPLAAETRKVALLRDLGAQRPLVLARGLGTGPVPSSDDAEIHLLDLPTATTLVGDIRVETAVLRDLPASVRSLVEAYDPLRHAQWWVEPHVEVTEVDGRPVIAPRRPEWVALEDKTVIDAIFDTCGVPRPPCTVTVPTYGALTAAARDLDAGAGTVWSGDIRDGMNGGAELVRWVRDDADARRAVELFAGRCARVRVAPFVDGVPCSIHGIVMPDGVAVLRPVEMISLRRPDGTFLYGGMATWWDPSPADREAMRRAARSVGTELAAQVDFRGGFSVDGVLGADGWVPTEVNTRYSGGLNMLSRALTDFPLMLLQMGVVEGVETGVRAASLEQALLTAADRERAASAAAFTTVPPAAGEMSIRTAEGSIVHGSSMIGGMVRFMPSPGALRTGEQVAPLLVRALATADEHWGTAFGECLPASAVR